MSLFLLMFVGCTSTTVTVSRPLEVAEDDPPPTLLGDAPPADTGWDGGALPLVLLRAEGPIEADERVPATVEVVVAHDGSLVAVGDAPRALRSAAAIEVRGTSSTYFPKLSYNLELQDDAGEDVAMSILGLPPEADWVLYGPYTDKTYVRDALAYRLIRRLGGYAPRVRFAEMFLDDAYVGIYAVTEKPELDGDRVDLPRPSPTAEGDLTGGYLLKIDGQALELDTFTSARGWVYEVRDPAPHEITPEQLAYLQGWMNQFEAAIAAGDDPALWIDVPSFVDYVLVNELSRNVDAYRRSTYLQKAPDVLGGRLHAGPVWDFNIAWGNAEFCAGWDPEGLVWEASSVCEGWGEIPEWWITVLRDPRFTRELRCRWELLRVGELSDAALAATIDELVLPLTQAEPRDHAQWGTLGWDVWPNWYVGATWGDELAYLRDFAWRRAAWLDAGLPGDCG
ncbi:MAG: CotH kinase family protein [Pseudomonadota bacterium]|nr:CotH kinase family protein [Pseudomonadota bacterium]